MNNKNIYIPNLNEHRYSKLNRDLGWKPSVTFEEGLAKTIDWFLENKEWLEHVTSGDYQNYYKKQYS